MTVESISIGISVFALIISVLSFYFTLFHNKHSLVATVAKWTNDPDPNTLDNICEIGVFNNGNRDLLIQSVEVDFSENSSNRAYPELNLNEVPCSLKAGGCELLAIPIPKLFMENAQNKDLLIKIIIYVYTIKGELRIATKNLTPIIGDKGPASLDWQPFFLRKVKLSDRQ